MVASSAFWKYMTNRLEHHGDMVKLLTSLAQDKIVHTGLNHLERGFITNEDYDVLISSLYMPYLSLGGNGTAKRIVELVKALPMREKYRPSDNPSLKFDE